MRHKYLVISVLLAIILTACSTTQQKEYKKVVNYFETTHNYKIDSTITKIVVIDEGKGCGTCDKTFAETCFKSFTKENTVFLVTAKGNYVDIQPFLGLEKNCYFDWQLNLKEYPEFGSSKVIYLKNNVIDTIVVINSSEIMQQLEFFKTRN